MPVVVTKDDVRRAIQAHTTQITALGVRRLGLFGSFARDAARSGSDVDVLVEFAPEAKTFDAFMQLAFLLEDVLGRPVELVTPESLSPYLRGCGAVLRGWLYEPRLPSGLVIESKREP